MRLHQETTCSAAQSFFAAACLYCPHCGEPMVAPAASEFVEGHGIHHHWFCDDCGRETHTTIAFARR